MSREYTVQRVDGPRAWQGGPNNATFHSYDLILDDDPTPTEISQKPETPAPQVGQKLTLDVTPHPRFDNKRKAKKAQQQFGGGGRPRSPEETAAIQRQHSQSAAIALAPLLAQAGHMSITDKAAFFKELRSLIDWLQDDIEVGIKRGVKS